MGGTQSMSCGSPKKELLIEMMARIAITLIAAYALEDLAQNEQREHTGHT
ncbi:MAG: hypothetical protein IPJ85_14140 [Flavobacteriales bacterium]|nr:hypothetical protein [Flavobacteriales bacterium]